MKLICVFILIIFSLSVWAKNPIDDQFGGRPSKYFYWELYPKEKLILIFEADAICPNNIDKINVDQFESLKKYPSNERPSTFGSVRILNVYAESFSACSNNPLGKIQSKLVVGPFPKSMTHIRLTVSDSVAVTASNDCGMVPPPNKK